MTEESKQPDSASSAGGADDARAEHTTAVAKKDKKNQGGAPPGVVIKPKPKLSKAERRALQEQQRAAKATKQQQPPPQKPSQKVVVGGGGAGGQQQPLAQKKQQQQPQTQSQSGVKSASSDANISGDSGRIKPAVVQDNSLNLFSHLPQYRGMPNPYAPEWTNTLHPDVIELGMKYASGEIHGDNARCRSMMNCFLQVLQDYVLPPSTSHNAAVIDFRTHFDHQVLKPSFQFWTVECRPHSVSMGNAFTFLKTAVSSLERDLPLEEVKEILQETIEQYLLERLEYADRAIAQHAMTKLQCGDVILTFGHSEVIEVLLTTAHKDDIDFYVWVADSRPLAEGKHLLKTLRQAGIPCGYIHLNALTYVLQQVTKVFLGASALMSNGSIYGRVGTAAVALLAKDRHIPVLVCCESYKISNKVQLESITQNELGNPEAILPPYKNAPSKIKVLNLMYDVTPSEFVSGIITELGIIPPTSVAVLLSEMNPQDASYM